MTQTIQEAMGERCAKPTVQANASLRELLEYMRTHDAEAVAINDGEGIVGVFTSRDILRRVVLVDLDLDKTTAEQMMSTPVHWILEDERYEVAKAIMVAQGVRQVVVLDGRREFAGFITSRMVLEADLTISRELVTKLNDSYYAPRFEPRRRV